MAVQSWRILGGSAFVARQRWLKQLIKDAIEETLTGVRFRRCFTCGHRFVAKHNNHFFCESGCRKRWYAGMFVRRRKPGARKAA